MIFTNFKGYLEGADLTKIPVENLAYPSKDVIVNKGKISTRGGILNDGVAPTVTEATHSEFVWKDAKGGIRVLRVHGNTVQLKYNSLWYTIFTGISTTTTRVLFATWVDGTGAVVKKRLFFADGSTTLYQWNGAMGVVDTATTNSVDLVTDDTCLLMGFDAGDVTAQTLMHYIGSAVIANSEETQTNNPTAKTLSISGTFDTTPIAGDIIIAKPTSVVDAISSTFTIEAVYSFQNHLVVASYESVNLFLSHIETYSLASGLDFTQPTLGSRTAITPIFMALDGNFTAMISRKNVLWVSDADDWYKLTKTTAINAYGLWVDVEKFETGERKGALPMAVAKHKGDIIYMAQDNSLERITTLEVLGTDTIELLSDGIEGLLSRVDMADIRLYYIQRALYIILPVEGMMLMLDMVEGYFQPPQYLPINCMSVIDGVKYGHSNAQDETYVLFSGGDDLGTPMESKIAFGYYSGNHPLRYKAHTMIGFSVRIPQTTSVSVDLEYEEEGSKTSTNFIMDGATVKTYKVNDDVSWATHPYAERSIAGADMVVEPLKRATVFKKFDAVSYFDFRPTLTITGENVTFHLMDWMIDDHPSPRKIGSDLFIS